MKDWPSTNWLISNSRAWEALRREIPDEMIVPEGVGVWGCAADVELSGVPGQRRRTHTLLHGPGNLGSAGTTRVADGVRRGEEPETGPSAGLMQVGKGVSLRWGRAARAGTSGSRLADRDGDGRCGGTVAVVPLLDGGVIGTGAQRQS